MASDSTHFDKIKVFYDGSCPLCVREIAMLRRTLPPQIAEWRNIAPDNTTRCDDDGCGIAPNDEIVADGLTRRDAMKRFHIRDQQGRLISGAPAFLTLWQYHKHLGWLAKTLSYPPLIWILELVYRGFLLARPGIQKLARYVLERA